MMRKYHVRFGGGRLEKEPQGHLASRLPNITDMGANNAGIMTPATRRVVAAARAYVDAECRRVDAEAANGQPGSYRRMVAADAAARRALYRLADAVDGLEREERTTSRGRQLAADAGAMD